MLKSLTTGYTIDQNNAVPLAETEENQLGTYNLVIF